MSKGKVIVGMSGGVDSTVAALLLKEQGYDVTGVHMSVWSPTQGHAPQTETKSPKRDACYCPGDTADRDEAAMLSEKIGIPFQVLDVSAEYSKVVLDYFSNEYADGRTPNPCVACNQKIKFGALLDKVKESHIQFDYFATGHYVNLHCDEKANRYMLSKAKDLSKDQTYFLYRLSQDQLKHCLFPLGNLLKKEVKAIAKEHKLGVDEKPESQNFVNGDYSFLLKQPVTIGDFVTRDGTVLGQHRGIAYYTIGQRKGLGIAAKTPLYVLEIKKDTNQVILGTEDQLSRTMFTARDASWMSIDALTTASEFSAKIRYASPEGPAIITPQSNNRVQVDLLSPQRAITPGQSVVFYDGDTVVGGAIIE